jgi:hypothetical protein
MLGPGLGLSAAEPPLYSFGLPQYFCAAASKLNDGRGVSPEALSDLNGRTIPRGGLGIRRTAAAHGSDFINLDDGGDPGRSYRQLLRSAVSVDLE